MSVKQTGIFHLNIFFSCLTFYSAMLVSLLRNYCMLCVYPYGFLAVFCPFMLFPSFICECSSRLLRPMPCATMAIISSPLKKTLFCPKVFVANQILSRDIYSRLPFLIELPQYLVIYEVLSCKSDGSHHFLDHGMKILSPIEQHFQFISLVLVQQYSSIETTVLISIKIIFVTFLLVGLSNNRLLFSQSSLMSLLNILIAK